MILLDSIMAAVGSMSLISVLKNDCCEHFVLFGGLCETIWPSPRIEFDEPAFGPLQPREYRGFSEVGAFGK